VQGTKAFGVPWIPFLSFSAASWLDINQKQKNENVITAKDKSFRLSIRENSRHLRATFSDS
jgi:hypothetical protein